jgi:hypothetical protein
MYKVFKGSICKIRSHNRFVSMNRNSGTLNEGKVILSKNNYRPKVINIKKKDLTILS